ncbi:MAG: hypothetical protein A3I14_19380 [Candidatus Rokubacteria bacterium RIFCSPLOWO2_02_FULL_73_56]|nr:MAG: hypothetical protein A3I14_19380 [Candidatus Rokubacteria bacterium RIFCSPLOWO2_02_FULL_73_56]
MNGLPAALFPEPPRRVPAYRALSVALRTVHLATFAALLGGHLFDVDAARLLPWLYAMIASGAGLMALELAVSCAWLSTGKGLAVLVKLSMLAVVPWCWGWRVPILFAVVALASVAAHMPRRFRHYQLLPALRGSTPPR